MTETKTRKAPPVHRRRYPRNLFGDGDSNTKLRKNAAYGFETLGLSLAPHKSGGIGNLCTDSTVGCIAACLAKTGRANIWRQIMLGRKRRARIWHHDKQWFTDTMKAEIARAEQKALDNGNRLAVRLNVFSDIVWEHSAPSILADFPDVSFYDYTKHPQRVGAVLPNYWVTFSRSETNETQALEILASGRNVAVVFADTSKNYVGNRAHLQRLPQTWRRFPVFDGDLSDLRFDDPRGRTRGRVVGLRLKSSSTKQRERAIASGFALPC